jgi:prepilin-type N-terminal cleavage/methylation domain-containing protein
MILKHLGNNRRKEHGFTLVELLVAMTMTAVVMTAVYTLYKSQQDSYVAQDQVVEMQQNIRASFYQLARDLRMAGFNRMRSPDVKGLMEPGELQGDPGTETRNDPINLAFAIDQNQDGSIQADDHTEQIAYRFNDTDPTDQKLEKLMFDDTDNTWKWRTVADNIDTVNFVYRDGDNISVDPTTAENLPLIRSIEISITARTKTIDRDLNDYRRRTLTTTIFCRNLGL